MPNLTIDLGLNLYNVNHGIFMTSASIINEVTNGRQGDWRLCFQLCELVNAQGALEHGYRFIWRGPDDSLLPVKSESRMFSSNDLYELMQQASVDGWFVYS